MTERQQQVLTTTYKAVGDCQVLVNTPLKGEDLAALEKQVDGWNVVEEHHITRTITSGLPTIRELTISMNTMPTGGRYRVAWRERVRSVSHHFRPFGLCPSAISSVSFGKPVAEATSDAIQVRRAMAHRGSSKVDSLPVIPRYVLALILIALAFARVLLRYFRVPGAFFPNGY
ncbi:MAG TPA: hypothetical protein VGF19_05710, partial [Candidatus Acidoferrum sp.]